MPGPVLGGVYWVRDDLLVLIPAKERSVQHDRRMVVVVSGSETNASSEWPFILACPISGSTKFRTRYCVKLAQGEGNVDKKSWVRVPAVQPLEKATLQDLVGYLPGSRLTEIQTRLVEYMGLFASENDEPSSGPAGSR